MKAFFKDIGIQLGAVIVLGIGVLSAAFAAGQFMPHTPFF